LGGGDSTLPAPSMDSYLKDGILFVQNLKPP
jgi:hypothetical protein